MSSPESYHIPILPPFEQKPSHEHRSKYDHTLDTHPIKEIGKIMRTRDSYGFLYSHHRDEELFFHFSEIMHTASNPNGVIRVGDDVEYEHGYSTSNSGVQKVAAFRVKVVNLNSMRLVGRVEKVHKGNNVGIIRLEDGLIVRYTPEECRQRHIGRHDVVECSLNAIGKKLLAKEIIILESHEEKILQNIEKEQGVIVSLKNESYYGFIQSIKRKEHVYFHYSHLIDPSLVKIGKCVEFKVIDELLENGSCSLAARQIDYLPDGSVEFRSVVCKDVKGCVVTLPHEVRKKKKFGVMSHPGTISLSAPIEDGEKVISTVLFHAQDSPIPLQWLKQGDEFIFDISIEHVDQTHCATSPKLTQLALPGRNEGIISVLKENGYGFISLMERQTDVYFRSENLLPSNIQKMFGDKIDLEAGTEVSFDLSIKQNGRGSEKENIKAHRILPLPKGSILIEKTLAQTVKGVITQIHQDGSGYIELNESIQGMSFGEHHPIISKMLNEFMEDENRQEIVYSDVQSPHESRFIIALAESKGLNVSFVNDTTDDNTFLRLKISKDDEKKKKKLKTPKAVKLVRFDKKYACYTDDSVPCAGDVITCDVIHTRRTQTYSAINLSLIERPPQIIPVVEKSKSKKQQSNCIGLVLMEPAHSNISNNHYSSTLKAAGKWDTPEIHHSNSSNMSDGYILLLQCKDQDIKQQHVVYHNEHHRNHEYHPKRGEFVSFHYNKDTGKVRDIKLVKDKDPVIKLIGTLSAIGKESATFALNDKHDKLSPRYDISTDEILGCDVAALTSKTQVEAIYYQDQVYGICRTADLYLTTSKITPSKQRPRLNLTVRKELGGKVVAQSCMAKGPLGGTIGFVKGWTMRESCCAVLYG